jgi:outer membrane receptor for ferric coprogen and ferric-rhodotorulic acid
VVTGVLAAVDSRGEWERGGGDVSWESSFTVSGEIVGSSVQGGWAVCNRLARLQMTVQRAAAGVAAGRILVLECW